MNEDMFFEIYDSCKTFGLEPALQFSPNLICPHIKLIINTQINNFGKMIEARIAKEASKKNN